MAMEPDIESPPKKRGLLIPLILGVVLAALGGGGGYWAVTQGPFAPPPPVAELATDSPPEPAQAPVDTAFVPLETVVVALGPNEGGRHLIFTAELEVAPDYEAEVNRLTPRVLDIFNSYLRVISVSELNDPASLGRLRAQLLRRVQVVTGAGRVHDLLITQFVVN
ncbi:MAG: flagellar basal body-associated FliL family protein [Pseudomonadota bacterium]